MRWKYQSFNFILVGLLVIGSILTSGCIQQVSQKQYVCPDGSIVNNPSLCSKLEEKEECVEQTTFAISPEGKCYEFPTTCIPKGWVRVEKCPVELNLDKIVEVASIRINNSLPMITSLNAMNPNPYEVAKLRIKDMRILTWESAKVLLIILESYTPEMAREAVRNISQSFFVSSICARSLNVTSGESIAGECTQSISPFYTETRIIGKELILVYIGETHASTDRVYAWNKDKFGFVISFPSKLEPTINELVKNIVSLYK